MRIRLEAAAASATVALLVLTASQCSARSSNSKSSATPRTVYDQKQTGDYNIQLHLKDFQVIALLAGEGGGLGDYDYAYDYSDFTVKPGSQKPHETSSSHPPSTTPLLVKPETSSSKPSNHPYPIVSPPSTKPPTPQPSTAKPEEITTPKLVEDGNDIPNAGITLTKLLSGDFTQNITQSLETNTTNKTPKLEETMAPGKIKVQIIQSPPLGIVPDEDAHEQNDAVPQIEGGTMVKRCATGFTRDKRGRCRRVRKPASHLPFGFSRFASNLASRFQHPVPESSISSSSESSEE